GPFVYDDWQQGVTVNLKKNTNHWDAENIKLEKIVAPIHPNSNSVLMFEEGTGEQQLDWTTLSAADYERFSADAELSTLVQPYVYPGVWMLL
ncbi:hypothetical protein RCL06_24220, partial [Salmonella enterica subsp. enterica serovar Typhimurium]